MATQDTPIEHGSDDADDDDKIEGIVEQVRADSNASDSLDPALLLRQRLSDAGIEVGEEQFERLLRRVAP